MTRNAPRVVVVIVYVDVEVAVARLGLPLGHEYGRDGDEDRAVAKQDGQKAWANQPGSDGGFGIGGHGFL